MRSVRQVSKDEIPEEVRDGFITLFNAMTPEAEDRLTPQERAAQTEAALTQWRALENILGYRVENEDVHSWITAEHWKGFPNYA